jgi:peptide chain release factor 2
MGEFMASIALDELRLELLAQSEKLAQLKAALHVDEALQGAAALEASCAADGFWDDLKNSKETLQKIAALKRKAESFGELKAMYDDAAALVALAIEEDEESLLEECREQTQTFRLRLDALTLSTLLGEEYDAHNAILTFHAGAGGTEAQDWNEMLVRMMEHWAQRHGYKAELTDFLDGEEAGLKSAVLRVEGVNAYGFLRGEHGIHRLVRCSPFDGSGRRHTSFASVEVMPEIDDDIDVEISPDDIKMDVYRASGAGGQKVNKTSSAVRLTHIPTGIVCACQVERSQHQNREVALRMLKSKLLEIMHEEHVEKLEDIKGAHKEIGWGSQIRSYVFMPYQMVKDHRTEYETGNIANVLDGDLDGFIQAYLQQKSGMSADVK